VEATDPGAPRALGERLQQRGADPVSLPVVDDRDGHLGGFEVVLEADVTGDRDRRARRRRVRDQRLVMPVVDVEEPGKLTWRQLRLGGEEALVAGPGAQMPEREVKRSAIDRAQLADGDLIRHR
jgi:hypothetical protein